MRRLGDILAGQIQRGDDGDELYAAAVVGAANTALGLTWPPHQAQAISFQRGEVVIAVAHGAIAGQIQQTSGQLCAEINQRLAIQFPRIHQPVNHLRTRSGLTP